MEPNREEYYVVGCEVRVERVWRLYKRFQERDWGIQMIKVVK